MLQRQSTSLHSSVAVLRGRPSAAARSTPANRRTCKEKWPAAVVRSLRLSRVSPATRAQRITLETRVTMQKLQTGLCSSARSTVSFVNMFKAVAAVSVSLATGLLLAACQRETKFDRDKVVTTKSAASHAHTNRLSREKSPYLLQHQHNPVDWFAWGDEAFKKARKEKKPIFLSIGYSTCHWCHVMERESFEKQEIADYLKAHFVGSKVDREE